MSDLLQHKQPRRLRRMKIRRIALVDNPASQDGEGFGAFVTLVKRDDQKTVYTAEREAWDRWGELKAVVSRMRPDEPLVAAIVEIHAMGYYRDATPEAAVAALLRDCPELKSKYETSRRAAMAELEQEKTMSNIENTKSIETFKALRRELYADAPERKVARAARVTKAQERFADLAKRIATETGCSLRDAYARAADRDPMLAEASRAASYGDLAFDDSLPPAA